MSIHTVSISRNMSAELGISNNKPLGQVLNIHPGDICTQWDGQPDWTKAIFYRVCMDITDEQIASLEETRVEDPEKRLMLNTNIFTAGEIAQLQSRQIIVGNIGQTPTFSDLYFEDI